MLSACFNWDHSEIVSCGSGLNSVDQDQTAHSLLSDPCGTLYDTFFRDIICQISHFPNKPWFLRDCSTSLLKTLWEKEKLLKTSNFSFSHSVFYLSGEYSAICNKLEIVVCKLVQFGRV